MSIDAAEIRGTLAAFIFDELLEDPYDGLDPLADEMVDSLGQEQLVAYIYEVYGVELDDEEMVKENFESLTAVTALVISRLSGPQQDRGSDEPASRSGP